VLATKVDFVGMYHGMLYQIPSITLNQSVTKDFLV